jgi:hypothetical protein
MKENFTPFRNRRRFLNIKKSVFIQEMADGFCDLVAHLQCLKHRRAAQIQIAVF